MAQNEDTELRDLVIEALEKNGSLANVRALLRANVFLVFEDECENVKQNVSLDNLLKQPEGALCLSIIHEFLEFCNLKNTLFVYMAESRQRKEYVYEGQKKLSEKLNFPLKEDKKEPILVKLLKQISQSSQRKYYGQNDSCNLKGSKCDEHLYKDDQNCTYIVHEDSSSSATSNSLSDNSSDEKNKLHLRLPLDNSDTDTSSDFARERTSSEYIPSEHIMHHNRDFIDKNTILSENKTNDNKQHNIPNAYNINKNDTNILHELKLINNNSSSDSTSYVDLKPYKPLDEKLVSDPILEANEKDVTDSASLKKSDAKSLNEEYVPQAQVETKIDSMSSGTLSSGSIKIEEAIGVQAKPHKNSHDESEKSNAETAEYSNDFTLSPVTKHNKDTINQPPFSPESIQDEFGTKSHRISSFENQHHSSQSSQSSVSISDVADLISDKSSYGYQASKDNNSFHGKSSKTTITSKKASNNDKSKISDDSGDYSESPIPSLSNLSLDIHSD